MITGSWRAKMTMTSWRLPRWPRRFAYPLAGLSLSLGMVAGLLALEASTSRHVPTISWIFSELRARPLPYAYLLVATLVMMTVIGWIVGRKEDLLGRLSTTDPLTGLANRRLLVDRIDQALTGTDRGARSHCLLYLDLDGFKQVNDRYGHAAGDEVLRLLAERMSALLRPEDTAARLGGDEFAILCVNADPRHAETIAERLRAAVAEPLFVDGQQLALSATVGVSSSDVADDPPPADPADLLRRADLEMYQRKRQRASSP